MISIRDFQFNPYMTNCYLLWDESRECVICDPGMCSESECRRLDDFIAAEGLRPVALILTHGHGDHTAGVTHCLRKYGIRHICPCWTSRPSRPLTCTRRTD